MKLELPHRRKNPLTGEWVLVSPQRTKRPWLGQVEKGPKETLPDYDPTCYLCPGNRRNTGKINPDYPGTYVFNNDFAALLPPEPDRHIEQGEVDERAEDKLYAVQYEVGICRVVCFSPRHDLGLDGLSQEAVEEVVKTWIFQTRDLSNKDFVHYVQVFENKGAMMGASNPHPHSQIWATAHIPNEPAKEEANQAEYFYNQQGCLLCDCLQKEKEQKTRLILQNESFTAMVPFWAIWPFEVLLVANRHIGSLLDLSEKEIFGLADMMRKLTRCYDRLFDTSFPYSMGFHQVPFDGKDHPGWHLHAHYYPPLLRSATVRKFMVGYEMLAMPQRDITPESAAERLRSLRDQP